jgi:hypothetical protein
MTTAYVALGAVANDTVEEASRCEVSCSVVTPSDPNLSAQLAVRDPARDRRGRGRLTV